MSKYEDVQNNEDLVTLSVDIPQSLKDRIKFTSYKEKKPIKDIVKDALEEYLSREAF